MSFMKGCLFFLFLKRFFSGAKKIASTQTVRLEYYKEGKTQAAYVGRREQGNMVDQMNIQSKAIEPPYLKPKTLTSVTTRSQRSIGENPFEAHNPAQDKAADIGEKMAILERQIQRAEEVQCSNLLLNGKIEVKDIDGKKITDDINFDVPNSHRVTLSGNSLWSDTTNANPLKQARDAHRKVSQASGLTIDTAVMGTDASEAFINHPKVQNLLQTTFPKFADIQEEFRDMGVIYFGRIGSVDYFSYEASVKLGTTTVNIMDTKKVIYGSSMSGAHMIYALPEHEEAVPTDRFPDMYTTDDPSGTVLQLHSAPLANPHYIDGFYTAQVLS